MPDFNFPGVYVEEIDPGMRPIEGVSTTVTAFVGFGETGQLEPALITSFDEYKSNFGGFAVDGYLPHAVHGFFQNGGARCCVLNLPRDLVEACSALAPLDEINDISIVCCPDEYVIAGMTATLVMHCEHRHDRVAILAAPVGSDLSKAPPLEAQSSYAAYYAPWVMVENPAGGAPIAVHPGGHIAGAIVANDLRRGIHKAPANIGIAGIVGLERNITKQQQDSLNPHGVNVLRSFPSRGCSIWGARTTSTDPVWKYINIRRLLIYLEQSIQKGTQWAVFEPNGEELWSNIRRTIEDFLMNMWQSGALLGSTPKEAYFVRCDRTTMTQDDIDNGTLICLVGVAPVKPAEFVVFRICHKALTTQC